MFDTYWSRLPKGTRTLTGSTLWTEPLDLLGEAAVDTDYYFLGFAADLTKSLYSLVVPDCTFSWDSFPVLVFLDAVPPTLELVSSSGL